MLQLAKHNPKELFLAARTQSKAEAAIEDIKKSVPEANISFVQLDLTSLASVRKCAEELKARVDRLDILINNAGTPQDHVAVGSNMLTYRFLRHYDDGLFQDG